MKCQGTVKLVFLFCAVIFSLFTVFVQVQALGGTYLQEWQLERHNAVLQGTALGHWQYRVLSDYLVEAIIILLKKLQLPYPIICAFILFRLFQNTVLFFMAALYYKKLGLPFLHTLIGLSLLAWGMSHALYGSDLQFSTYSDIIFYLLAGVLILYKRYLWILPVTILATLNRDTSGLIPFMLGISGYVNSFSSSSPRIDPINGGKGKVQSDSLLSINAEKQERRMIVFAIIKERLGKQGKEMIIIAALSLVSYFLIILGLRYFLGPRPPFYPHGIHFGLELFVYNIAHIITWVQLFATLGFLPILSLITIRRWPDSLQYFFWAIVPAWFIIHPFLSVMAETRNFLVPHTLIFIPGSLFGLIPPSSFLQEEL